MPAGVMLDDLNLPLVQDVRTSEDRAWVAHRVPGLDGAAYQHLGRRPAVVIVVGLAVDDESLAMLEHIRAKFKDHQPVPFTADITTSTDIKQVVIDDLRVTEVAGRPQQYRYVLRLVEFIPPPPPVAPMSAPGVDLSAASIIDNLTGALGDLPELPGLLDLNLINPTPPLTTVVDGFAATAGQIGDALGPLNNLLR